MKKFVVYVLAFSWGMTAGFSYAEDAPAPETPIATEPAATAPEVPAPLPVPTATPATEAPLASSPDNLEFVSGEITSADEAAKTVTVKLYGEAEDGTTDKALTVQLDDTTDITDGEQDRDIKSLTTGTEVDVEYDPTTNKATYIFVY